MNSTSIIITPFLSVLITETIQKKTMLVCSNKKHIGTFYQDSGFVFCPQCSEKLVLQDIPDKYKTTLEPGDLINEEMPNNTLHHQYTTVDLPWVKKNKKYEVFTSNSKKLKPVVNIYEEGNNASFFNVDFIKKMTQFEPEKKIAKFKTIHAKEIAFFTEKGIECRVDFGMLVFTEEF